MFFQEINIYSRRRNKLTETGYFLVVRSVSYIDLSNVNLELAGFFKEK